MTRIDASLFAHITNDAYLEGTYALQGQQFANTIGYLKQYIDFLKPGTYPDRYAQLLQDLKDVVEIDNQLNAKDEPSAPTLKSVADTLCNKVLALAPGEVITLPGGWQNQSGGHAMLYQLIRTADGYQFNVINTGDGIERYHHRLSSTQKELFSPVKTWTFPVPDTEQSQKELKSFIFKLLKARILQKKGKKQKAVSAQMLYEEIFQTGMSFLHGQEIEPQNVPEFAYTGGQLSGTCAQRVLDKLLEIHAPDQHQADLFLFKYLMYALQDYYALSQTTPITKEMQKFIVLAIRKGLQTISTPGMIEPAQISVYEEQLTAYLTDIQKSGAQAALPAAQAENSEEKNLDLHIKGHATQYIPKEVFLTTFQPAFVYIEKNDFIDLVKDFETKYLVDFPTNAAMHLFVIKKMVSSLSGVELSSRMIKPAEYIEKIDFVQNHITFLQKHWLTSDCQLAEFNILTLILTHSRSELQDRVNQAHKLPSYQPFVQTIMRSILGNQSRNAYMATNDYKLDEQFNRLQALYSKSKVATQQQLINYFKALIATQPQSAQKLKAYYQKLFKDKTTPLHVAIRNEGLEALYILSLWCHWSFMNDNLELYQAREMIRKDDDERRRAVQLIDTVTANIRKDDEERKQPYRDDKTVRQQAIQIIKDEGINVPDDLTAFLEPLVKVLNDHLAFEVTLRKALNPWMDIEYSSYMFLSLQLSDDHKLLITSTLSPLGFLYERPSQVLAETRFALTDSAARDVLLADYPECPDSVAPLTPRTSNHIQLHRNPYQAHVSENQKITQIDIGNRNYYYLRLIPSIQVQLTIEYFLRNIHKLADVNNQRYLEANIMQPSLYKQRGSAALMPELITAGIKHFTQNGRHTQDSLFLLRLQFLLATSQTSIDTEKLKKLVTVLRLQIELKPEPDLRYFFEQYMFLSLTLILSRSKALDEIDKTSLIHANFYINSHTNPMLLEDLQHSIYVQEISILYRSQLRSICSDCICYPEDFLTKTIKAYLDESQLNPVQTIYLKPSAPYTYMVCAEIGCDVYFLNQLPHDFQSYLNSYIILQKNNAKTLYYVSPNGGYEVLQIYIYNSSTQMYEFTHLNEVDFKMLERRLNPYRTNNQSKIHLNTKQAKECFAALSHSPESETVVCEVNLSLGKVFKGTLALSSLPLTIQNHPLAEQLGFKSVHECMMNTFGDCLYFHQGASRVYILLNKGCFTVNKQWTINGETHTYELQPLSKSHLAYIADPSLAPAEVSLPSVLTDGNINYWQHTDNPEEGFLALDNHPIYHTKNAEDFIALDAEGKHTPRVLPKKKLPGLDALYAFENKEFLIATEDKQCIYAELPRFQLTFTKDKRQADAPLVLEDTQETLVKQESPIKGVSGLRLRKGKHDRLLVPVARFYHEAAKNPGGFYPFIHDTKNTIPESCLASLWERHPIAVSPLWHYRQSASYVSFRLKNNQVIADSLEDSLYLAYLYLASNKPYKAWNSLNECVTRFGGLKGDLKELELIRWILLDLPYIADNRNQDEDQQKAPVRNTPPYLACQLKALSLICDLVLRGKHFDFEQPKTHPTTANDYYAKLQYEENEDFYHQLKNLIYEKYTRFQNMQGHIPAKYSLTVVEKKRLLNVLFQDLPAQQQAYGSLGWEWTTLSLDSVISERDVLRANPEPTAKETERLDFIERSLSELRPVLAQSTRVEQVRINIDLPSYVLINRSRLSDKAVAAINHWDELNCGEKIEDQHQLAIQALSSTMKEDLLVQNFATLFQIASMPINEETAPLKVALETYCAKVLRATHFTPLQEQHSNKGLLCNLLYRSLHNASTIGEQKTLSFERLLEICHSKPVPAILVYKPVNVYETLLDKPRQLKQPDHRLFVPMTLPKTPSKPFALTPELEAQLKTILTQYKAIEKDTEQQLDQLSKNMPKKPKEALQVEKAAGVVLYKQEVQFKHLAQSLSRDPQLVDNLRQTALETEQVLTQETTNLWEQAIQLANQGPDDPKQAQQWNIEKQARTRLHLNAKDLMSLYVQADYSYYYEKTHLSQDHAQKLHECIHKALLTGKQLQCAHQIQKALKSKDSSLSLEALQEVLQILVRDEIPASNDPSVVLLQHEQDLLLRKRQTQALEVLLETKKDAKRFNEVVEKVIMGGGKSKVILPILAEKKAQGDNLVVVEVPQALLATNYVDLNQTSQRLFGKNAFLFEFNRDSNVSPQRLKQLFEQFKEVMSNRSYLVTTGESIQALELKYIELLIQTPQDDTWKEQMYWYDQIIKLFNNQADCIIDEVHLGLWIKKKLNFTLGTPEPLNQNLLNYAAELFSIVEPSLIKKAPSLPNDFDWQPYQLDWAKRLVGSKTGSLNQFIKRAKANYGSKVEQELIDYLTNQSKTLAKVVLEADPATKMALAFFKQEISKLLPLTLSKKLDKNYGASKIVGLSPVEQTLAIPYVANNTPNERSRFGNELEAINYTAQMLILKGISQELIKERIDQWKALASVELHTFNYPSLDKTPIAENFNLMTKDLRLRLSQINTQDAKQMAIVHAFLKHHPTQLAELLKERTLKQIKKESATITSDAFNHKSFYRSVQAVSGTPYNAPTFHQDLKYNRKASLGTDGYILELIKNKNPLLFACDYTDVKSYLEQLLSGTKNLAQTRAIVDIKAAFQGVYNLEVAQALAVHIKQLSEQQPGVFVPAIKHILYFNEQQVLCALSLKNPQKPIVLGTTDTQKINRILGSKPEERFTYYDQAHAQGVDIKQADHAHALVLVDEKTSLQEFLQGSMRMRQLSQNQSIELVLPQRLQSTTLDRLYDLLPVIDEQELVTDMPFAVNGKMANILRSTFLRLISDLPSTEAERKAELHNFFEPFFIHVQTLDLFALYGGLDKKHKAVELFDLSRSHLITLWEDCVKKSNQVLFTEEENQRIKKEMSDVIKKALPYCLAEYETSDELQDSEVELQTEIHKQIEVELVKINECYDPNLIEAPFYDLVVNSELESYYQQPENQASYLSLNEVCGLKPPQTEYFSNQLHTSRNYAHTHDNQTEFTGVFLKPVYLTWYHMEDGQLHAMIITHEDFNELEPLLGKLENSWIATTHEQVLAGKAPKPSVLKSEAYLTLREQIRFFNGEFDQFINQVDMLYWINEKPLEKIAFYAEKLLKARAESEVQFHQLSTVLTQAKVDAFTYISEHPFKDYTDFDWNAMYPDISILQIETFQRFARAIAHLCQIQGNTFDAAEVLQRYQLPLNSMVFMHKLWKKILETRSKLQQLCATDIESSLMDNLTKEQEEPLAFALNCTKDEIPSKLQNARDHCIREKNIIIGLSNNPMVGSAIDGRVLKILNMITTVKELGELTLDLKRPSANILASIIKHKNISNDILGHLLFSNKVCDDSILKLIIKASREGWIFVKALEHPVFSDSTLNELCMDASTTPSQLQTLLEKSPLIAAKHRLSIWMHANLPPNLRSKLLSPPLFDESFIEPLLAQNRLASDNLCDILKNNVLSPNQVESILAQAKDPSVLASLIESKNFVQALSDPIKKHPCFNSDIELQLHGVNISTMSQAELLKFIDTSMQKLAEEIKNNISEERQRVLEKQLLDCIAILDVSTVTLATDIFSIRHIDLFRSQIKSPKLLEQFAELYQKVSAKAATSSRGYFNPTFFFTTLLENPAFDQSMVNKLFLNRNSNILVLLIALTEIGITNHLKVPANTTWDAFIRGRIETNLSSNRSLIKDYSSFLNQKLLDPKVHKICLNFISPKSAALISFPLEPLITLADGKDEELVKLLVTYTLRDFEKVKLVRMVESEHLINLLLQKVPLNGEAYKCLFGKKEYSGTLYPCNRDITFPMLVSHFDKFNLASKKLLQENLSDSGPAQRAYLVEQVTSPDSIDYLLQFFTSISSRTHTQADFISKLLEKENYQGTFKNEWKDLLPEINQLFLLKAQHFDNLMLAVKYLKQNNTKEMSWISNLQKQAARHYNSAPTPEKKYDAALECLKLKALQHALKTPDKTLSVADAKRRAAAEKAFELYHQLKANNPFQAEDWEEKVKVSCKKIKKAEGVLGEHRGYKQSWLNILNAIVALLSGNRKNYAENKWIMWKSKTDSEKTVDKVENILKDIGNK